MNEKLAYIKELDFLYWVWWDFYWNVDRFRDFIHKFYKDYDFYVEILKSSDEWDEYIILDYYDDYLKTLVIVDEDLNDWAFEFEDEKDVLDFAEKQLQKVENMKKKIRWKN